MIPKLRRLPRFAGWLVAALLCCGISSTWGQAPAAPAVPEYVTADAFAMLDVRWGELRKVPFWNYIFRSRIQVRFERINGPDAPITKFCNGLWNLEELESFRLVFDAGPLGTLPVGGYAVLRLSRPLDLPTLTGDRLGLTAPTEHLIDGLKYRTYKNLGTPKAWDAPLAILALDDRAVLLAPESSLKKILAAKAESGPLVEHWKRSPATTGLRFAAVSTELTRGLISLLLLGGGKAAFPAPFAGMPTLLPQIRAIDFRADANGKKIYELAFNMKNEAFAGEMAERLEEFVRKAEIAAEAAIRAEAPQQGAEKRRPFYEECARALKVHLRGTSAELECGEIRSLPAAVESWIDQERRDALFMKRYMTEWNGFRPYRGEGTRFDEEQRVSGFSGMPKVVRAMHDFAEKHKQFPADIVSTDGKQLLSWRVAILPYLGYPDLYEKFKLNEPWDSPHNKRLLKEFDFYSTDSTKPTETVMFRFRGPGTVLPTDGRKIVPENVTDGLENTLALALAAPDRSVPWTKPADIEFDPERMSETLRALPSDCDWALALLDGQQWPVKPLKPEILKALITMHDGEKVSGRAAFFGLAPDDEE